MLMRAHGHIAHASAAEIASESIDHPGHAAGLSWSLYFTAYNQAKKRYQGLLDTQRLSAPLHLASAAEAGVLVSGPSSR